MEIKKAEIKDLDIVVKMKMEMFTEVGSVSFLQDDAEKKIYEKYKELYNLVYNIMKNDREDIEELFNAEQKKAIKNLIET